MGAWGHGPFENDGAGDWTDSIRHKIALGVRSRDEEVVRAAAALLVLLDGSVYIGSDAVSDAIRRLEEMYADDRRVSDWNEPAKYREALKAQLKDLRAMLKREYARADRRRAQTARKR